MKKYNGIWIVLVLIFISISYSYSATITVVYPREGTTLSAAPNDSMFVFGRVTPFTASLTINDENVDVYENGTFLAYVPVTEGEFVFHCAVVAGSDSSFVDRHVTVRPVAKTVDSDSLLILQNTLSPSVDYELMAGDLYRVSFQGLPGCKAYFEIDGITGPVPMQELPPEQDTYWGEVIFGEAKQTSQIPVKGRYAGSYLIQSGDYGYMRPTNVYLVDDNGDTLSATLPGKLSIMDSRFPYMVETVERENVLRTAQGCGYYYFVPQGVKLWITGRKGEYLRARLSNVEEAWVPRYFTRPLPQGTVPPQTIVHIVRTQLFPDKSRVRVFTGTRLPYRIEQDPKSRTITIFMYGVLSDTDWIRQEFGDSNIRDIRWSQDAPGSYRLIIELAHQHQWGYNAGYDEQDHFYIDIKRPPAIESGWLTSPLKNRFIALDPGHGPDLGAVGPTGYAEKDANLALAEELGRQLQDKGAHVFFTREGNEGISLRGRKRMVEVLAPDVMLSLHHNAIPDGVNPYKSRGTSTYYYQPQSYDLAVLVQKHLLNELKLNNFGLFYDNLAMCRPTQMPSILIEPAFMMHPEEEMMILSKDYRKKCAKAIVKALEEFFETTRE